MEIMEFVLLAVPVVFLVGSILLAYKAVKSGAKRKTAVFHLKLLLLSEDVHLSR